jgi:hypothetical protein
LTTTVLAHYLFDSIPLFSFRLQELELLVCVCVCVFRFNYEKVIFIHLVLKYSLDGPTTNRKACTDFPNLNKLEISNFRRVFQKGKYFLTNFWNARRFLPLRECKRSETKVLEEYCWAITGGGMVVFPPVRFQCWSWDFNLAGLYIHIYFMICTLSCDLRRFRLASHLSERNPCVSRGESVCGQDSKYAETATHNHVPRESSVTLRADVTKCLGVFKKINLFRFSMSIAARTTETRHFGQLLPLNLKRLFCKRRNKKHMYKYKENI